MDLWHAVRDSARQLVQSRRLAGRRQAKFLSPEDVIFLIRHDRAKVNRLRTYLSWKDVRKNARESGGDAGPGGPGNEIDPLAEADGPAAGPGGGGDLARAAGARAKMRMPWEVTTLYTENLRALANIASHTGGAGSASAAQASALAEDEDDDEEDIEAQMASQQRLKVCALSGSCFVFPFRSSLFIFGFIAH